MQTFPFDFALTAALNTHVIVGSSTFVKTPTSMTRSISFLKFPFRATGTLREGMTTGETESSTLRNNFRSFHSSKFLENVRKVSQHLVLSKGGTLRGSESFIVAHQLDVVVLDHKKTHLLRCMGTY